MSLPMKRGARAIGDEVTSPAGQVNRARGVRAAAAKRLLLLLHRPWGHDGRQGFYIERDRPAILVAKLGRALDDFRHARADEVEARGLTALEHRLDLLERPFAD